MQENKTKDIEVTAIGKARISFLPKCEERVCCSTLVSLYNEMVYETGDIIDTMAYRVGLINASTYQYSLGTAIGLFKSVISCAFFGVGYLIAAKKLNYKVF